MVSFFIPKYSLRSKMEEEIPKLLRLLGYLISISKSAMFSVGSLHTWPTLLAALTWLKSQLEVSEARTN